MLVESELVLGKQRWWRQCRNSLSGRMDYNAIRVASPSDLQTEQENLQKT
jgi:hypothetical protein